MSGVGGNALSLPEKMQFHLHQMPSLVFFHHLTFSLLTMLSPVLPSLFCLIFTTWFSIQFVTMTYMIEKLTAITYLKVYLLTSCRPIYLIPLVLAEYMTTFFPPCLVSAGQYVPISRQFGPLSPPAFYLFANPGLKDTTDYYALHFHY